MDPFLLILLYIGRKRRSAEQYHKPQRCSTDTISPGIGVSVGDISDQYSHTITPPLSILYPRASPRRISFDCFI